MTITRRKSTVHATVSPILAKKLDEGTESEKYSSQSDLVSIALTEYFVREEMREHEKKMAQLYQVLIQHDEGRALVGKIRLSTQEKIASYIKAGNALSELGEYEEAKKCFAKAKALDENWQPEQPKKSGRITYASKKEREEECLKEMCPEPRELTPEEKKDRS